MYKKIIIIVSVFLVVIGMNMTIPVFANENGIEEAEYLYTLGLLNGGSEGFELNKKLNRIEAAVMIVRLNGDEQLVIANSYTHPFTDVPSWADSYVGYMYVNGLTTGKTETIYGSYDLISKEQYMTFLLRVLGYSDEEGDFYWGNSFEKALNIAMLTDSDVKKYEESDEFLRRHMVELTYAGLQIEPKGLSTTLINLLESRGAISPVIDQAKKIMNYERFEGDNSPVTQNMLQENIEKMIYDMVEEQIFDISLIKEVELRETMEKAMENISQVPTYSSLIKSYKMVQYKNELTISMDYNITLAKHEEAKDFAKKVILKIIKPDMSDIEKELAIHDYIIERVTYNQEEVLEDSVYTMYGALIKGSAVCHGYAESFQYMGYLAGLDTGLVTGEATSDGVTVGHAWNMVTLDGKTYHVDLTWDDPVMENNDETVSYEYFNVTDAMLEKSHSWNKKDYSRCDAVDYNYYVYRKLVVYGFEDLAMYIQAEINEDKDKITVKVIGNPVTVEDVKRILASSYGFGSVKFRVNQVTNVVTIEKVN